MAISETRTGLLTPRVFISHRLKALVLSKLNPILSTQIRPELTYWTEVSDPAATRARTEMILSPRSTEMDWSIRCVLQPGHFTKIHDFRELRSPLNTVNRRRFVTSVNLSREYYIATEVYNYQPPRIASGDNVGLPLLLYDTTTYLVDNSGLAITF